MPNAHICPQCGEELALQRATIEPIYGWNLVRCPGCGRGAVRIEHSGRRFWRQVRKKVKALAGLAGRVVMLGLVSLLHVLVAGALNGSTQQFEDATGYPGVVALIVASLGTGSARVFAPVWWQTGDNIALLVSLIIGFVLATISIMTLLRHRVFWVSMTQWLIWLLILDATIQVIAPGIGYFVEWDPQFGKHFVEGQTQILGRGSWLVAAVLGSVLAWPIGSLCRRTAAGLIRRRRWGLRRKIRRWRQNT